MGIISHVLIMFITVSGILILKIMRRILTIVFFTVRDPNGKNKQFFMGEAGKVKGKNTIDQKKIKV